MVTTTYSVAADTDTRLGGTDIAALVGVHPKKSPADVYLACIGDRIERERRVQPELGKRDPLYWGLQLERAVSQGYCDMHGVGIVEPPRLISNEWPFMSGSPDRFVVEPEHLIDDGAWCIDDGFDDGIEIKTCDWFAQGWRWDSDNILPDSYVVQVMWYMLLTGRERWRFAVLRGGNEYHEFDVERDDDLCAKLLETGQQFWADHVLTETPPPLDGSEGAFRLLRKLHPRANDTVIEVAPGSDIDRIAGEFKAMREKLSRVAKSHAKLKQQLMEACGDAKALKGADWRISLSGENGERPVKDNAAAALHLARELADSLCSNDGVRDPDVTAQVADKLLAEAHEATMQSRSMSRTMRPTNLGTTPKF